MKRFAVILILLALAAPVSWGTAATPPAATELKLLALTGDSLDAEQIGTGAGVILVIIRQGNAGGIKMLDFLGTLAPQLPAEKLLVVVSGADDRVLKAIAGNYPKLTASWYRDPENALAKKLDLTSSPAILGMLNGQVVWSKFGVTDQKLLEKTMRGWAK